MNERAEKVNTDVERIAQVIHEEICGCGFEGPGCYGRHWGDSLNAAQAVIAALKGAGDE